MRTTWLRLAAGRRRAAGWTRWRAARLAYSTGVCAPSTRHQLLHACLAPCLPPPAARQEDSEANHAGGQGRVADVAHPGTRCAPRGCCCLPALCQQCRCRIEVGRRALCTHHFSRYFARVLSSLPGPCACSAVCDWRRRPPGGCEAAGRPARRRPGQRCRHHVLAARLCPSAAHEAKPHLSIQPHFFRLPGAVIGALVTPGRSGLHD